MCTSSPAVMMAPTWRQRSRRCWRDDRAGLLLGLTLPTFPPLVLALVPARPERGRKRRQQIVCLEKPKKIHSGVIDEKRIVFDLISGHRNGLDIDPLPRRLFDH